MEDLLDVRRRGGGGGGGAAKVEEGEVCVILREAGREVWERFEPARRRVAGTGGGDFILWARMRCEGVVSSCERVDVWPPPGRRAGGGGGASLVDEVVLSARLSLSSFSEMREVDVSLLPRDREPRGVRWLDRRASGGIGGSFFCVEGSDVSESMDLRGESMVGFGDISRSDGSGGSGRLYSLDG